MSFNPNRSTSGAFEEAFEAWLSQAQNDDGDMSDVEDDVLLIEPPNQGNNGFGSHENTNSPSSLAESSRSYSSPRQTTGKKRQNLVIKRKKSGSGQRFHAYKAVLKKYSRRGWYLTKKSSSPGSQTDDSGVVSPGCDASVGTLKDVMEEGSDGCLSGDDSPPNIQDDFTSANGWASDTLYPQRLDSECPDNPPELIPSLQVPDMAHVLQNQGNIKETQRPEAETECPSATRHDKHSSQARRDLMCTSILEKYGFPSKENHRLSKSRKHSNTGRWKSVRSNGCHKLESSNQPPVTESCASVSSGLEKKTGNVCIERALSAGVDCETASYVSRNGCEIGASDSGAGSQSESCCEESPRHEHDNLVSSGHTKTKSPLFSCDSHRFTVIPTDNSKKTSISGSPPLVLKLKKCERKSNIKNSPPKYVAVEMVDSSETKTRKSESVEGEVFHNHSQEPHTCTDLSGSLRSKRVKAVRKNNAACPCCVGSKIPSRRKRHSRSHSDGSFVSFFGKSSFTPLPPCERKFIKQSLYLSGLQTKVHTLFSTLFPRLQPVLSNISPEGKNFDCIIDDVISLLQEAESEDDVKDSEELSGELEHLTLKGDNQLEPVYAPHVVLCRAPWQCLEAFREKVFLLVQLLLPELTLSMENNCYRSQRELERFLDKIIVQNKTNT